jgi:DUF971 family protein
MGPRLHGDDAVFIHVLHDTMPIPTELTIRQQSKVMEIAFDDGAAFSIPFELLRVYSPSAEVQGHGPGQETLQLGKRNVGINGVEPVGQYGVKPLFTDGHESGIFTWDYLYKLGNERDALWKDYMGRLHAAGFKDDSGREPIPDLGIKKGGGCGSGGCGCH